MMNLNIPPTQLRPNTPPSVHFGKKSDEKPDPLKGPLDAETLRRLVTTDFLENLGAPPRVHPNGFVQLDLNPELRLHIWGHPDIPRSRQPLEDIHDHVFDFRSWLLRGRIENHTFEPVPGDQFEVHVPTVIKGDDSRLHHTGKHCNLRPAHTDVVGEERKLDDTYTLKRGIFHRIVPDARGGATVIKKRGLTVGQNPNGPKPRVLLPTDQESDGTFSRYAANENDLWRIIKDVLNIN